MNDNLKRYLGHPLPFALSWVCGYSPTPGELSCLADAVWHGLAITDDGTDLIAPMASCAEHRPSMELTADFIHPMDTACGVAEATIWWDFTDGSSGCHVDWDTVARLAVELAVPVSS